MPIKRIKRSGDVNRGTSGCNSDHPMGMKNEGQAILHVPFDTFLLILQFT